MFSRAARSRGAMLVIFRLVNTGVRGQYSTSGVAVSYICAFSVCLMLFVRINLANNLSVVQIFHSVCLLMRLRNLEEGGPGSHQPLGPYS
jgi:hypothetical protein